MLEKRFMESIEYVELHNANFGAFSNTYALLIQSIGAELDAVLKEFCGFNPSDRKYIADYARIILTDSPEIKTIKIHLQEYNIEIQPFQSWDVEQPAKSLQWWSAFTDIKHNRFDQMHHANQENTLNILGALYLVEMMYLKRITEGTEELDIFDEMSNLFTLKNWSFKAVPFNQCFAVLSDIFENDTIITKAFDV